MDNITLKDILIHRIITELTQDMQHNLYNRLNVCFDDDIRLEDITEPLVFKLHKDYLIPPEILKGWLITKDITLE